MIGKTVSHFRILEKLGEGGMGVVYKAEDTSLQRSVALKFISSRMLGSDRAVARFIREAQAAAACEHPNVCTIYEVGDSDEGAFIAMAYVEGESLRNRLASGPLAIDEAIDTAIQVARGLGAAHKRGVVHRDIKPGNIMITPDGIVKVMDFGLARPREAMDLTQAGSVVGTIAYMSPEQTRGRDVDERSDIWALGVVLYEMVTGFRPFRGGSDQAVVYSVLNDAPDCATDFATEVPVGLEEIILKALAKPVSERYRLADEMLRDLQDLAGGASMAATRTMVARVPDSAGTNLPHQLTSFIGRGEVIAEARQLLAANRLLTLTGAGGCGKTRLAQEVGRSVLRDFADGVWIAELAPLRDGELLPQVVMEALGLTDAPNRTPVEALEDYLRRTDLLLVLDNCEHLLPACTSLVELLLRGCQGVRILATSREPLAMAGEVVLRVPSLAVPEAETMPTIGDLEEVSAVRLFVERAAAAVPGFALTGQNAAPIAEVCRRLDGIPLALELAAARVKLLPVSEIAERLENRFGLLSSGGAGLPARHQTLRALVDWSFEQLQNNEQLLLTRLSVFSGGWTLSTAEAVCAGEGLEERETLDLMSSLVEKSLVETHSVPEADHIRLRMHETIREYAWDELSRGGTESWLGRHRDHFLAMAEEAEPHLIGGADQVPHFRRLAAEHGNLRAALATCMAEGGDAVLALRLAGALGRYWEMRGHWNEGRRVCSTVLARPQADARTLARAAVLHWAGVLALGQYDGTDAQTCFEESLAIARDLGDRRGEASSLRGLAMAVRLRGEDTQARSLHQESLAVALELDDKRQIASSLKDGANMPDQEGGRLSQRRASLLKALELFREVGDLCGEADVLYNLGGMASNAGDLDEAVPRLEESLAISRELDNPLGVAAALTMLADAALERGGLERARVLAEESLQLTRKLGHPGRESLALAMLGDVARLEGEYERAHQVLEESLQIGQDCFWAHESDALRRLGLVCIDEGDNSRAREVFSKSLALRWEHRDGQVFYDVQLLGMLAAAEGTHERAARILGAAERLREEMGLSLSPGSASELEQWVSRVRSGIDDETFSREWTTGRSMPEEQAVEYALAPGAEEDSEGRP